MLVKEAKQILEVLPEDMEVYISFKKKDSGSGSGGSATTFTPFFALKEQTPTGKRDYNAQKH